MSDFDVTYQILTHPNVVITHTKGVINLSRYLEEIKKITLHPSFQQDTHYLHDFRLVSDITGDLNEHIKLAEFSVSLSSAQTKNVFFIIKDNTPRIAKFIEGYSLMASRSNRTYRIFPESKLSNALETLKVPSSVLHHDRFDNSLLNCQEKSIQSQS